jgi:hypothetical protein
LRSPLVHVGGRDESDVDAPRERLAHALVLALVENAEEARLQQWSENQAFLDQVITKGGVVTLASPLSEAIPSTFFAQEVEYLMGAGYVLNAAGTELVLGGR